MVAVPLQTLRTMASRLLLLRKVRSPKPAPTFDRPVMIGERLIK
jgi:hypothetical protein